MLYILSSKNEFYFNPAIRTQATPATSVLLSNPNCLTSTHV